LGSYNDPKVLDFIQNRAGGHKYLWCPLMRASNSTKVMQNLETSTWKGRAARIWKLM